MRICPSCKKNLGGYDYYFCSYCGVTLPSDLVNHSHEQHQHTIIHHQGFRPIHHICQSIKRVLRIVNPIYISLIAAALIILGLSFNYFFTHQQLVLSQLVQQIKGDL